MTEIKIPFTKTKIETIPADKLEAGCKGVELEISTSFKMGEGLGINLSKCHGGTPENTFAKMFFVFKDGVKNNLYDDLLSSSKTNFELSFEKEKVFLMVGGFCNFIDKTKPEIQVYPAPNSRKMGVFFEPKFSAKNDTKDLKKAIEKVKKVSKDILDNNQDLKDSLKEAQDRLKDLEKEQTSSDKDKKGNFEYITIKDHANFAEKGQDIVCAAISAITNGTVNFLQKNYQKNCRISYFPAEISIYPQNDNPDCQLCLKLMLYQLENIANSYPAYLKFKNLKVGEFVSNYTTSFSNLKFLPKFHNFFEGAEYQEPEIRN
ncbi:5326_t:CDS:2, partial [Funneliformis geosporum]